jgi:Tol biopolymer transport system component
MRHRLSVWLVSTGVLAGLCAGVGAPAAIAEPVIEADGASHAPALSADGRSIAFVSEAGNLLGGDGTADPNGVEDVFLQDTTLGTIRLISTNPATGDPADGPSSGPDISADGRYVTFASEASNLVPGDLNDVMDVFLYDSIADTLQLVSRKGTAGAQGNRASDTPSISSDGALVAFSSFSTNLVGNDTNNRSDVFVRNVSAGSTTRVSTDSSGKQANGDSFQPLVSPNGSVVAFASTASNLSKADPSRTRDVYVKVLSSGKTTIVSVRSDEVRGSNDSLLEDVSNSGRYVVMQSYSPLVKSDTNNTGDIFLRDRTAGTTIRVSKDGSTQANDQSFGASISDDGGWIVFQTWATNLLPGVDGNGSLTDVLEFRVATGGLDRISVDTAGGWPDAASYDTAMSGTGLRTCFASAATDVVLGDANGVDDVFCHTWSDAGRATSVTARISLALPVG